MSMQTVEYQGYGIDLGQFKSNNPKFNKFMQDIIDSDEFYDEMYDNMIDGEDVAIATPNNTYSFEFLIYIPSVIPVSSGTIKTYTKTEANNLIFDNIKNAIVSSKLTEYLDFKMSLHDFLTELKQIIDKNADFSYNQDWTDLV